jgi:hypothetical protein
MAHYTGSDLRLRAGGITSAAARSELSYLAKSVAGAYDVFLSHSVRDAVLVLGLKKALEAEKLTVYVDWLEDPDLDRSNVTALTAQKLRERMRMCRTMVYATSTNATVSRWMPWELGYFDAYHTQSRVAICPIQDGTGSYAGQEYLGVYKRLEEFRYQGALRPFAVKPSLAEGEMMQSFIHGVGQFLTIERN